jgi:ketosteroid isomerase-like protein
MLSKWFMFSFAGLSIYSLLAKNPEVTSARTENTQTLVTSMVTVKPATSPISTLALLDQENQAWLNHYNQAQDVSAFYLDRALLFAEKSAPIQGNTLIAGYFTQMQKSVSKFKSIHPYKRFTETENLIYESGYLTTDNQETFSYLTVWNNKNGAWKRELEAIARKTANDNSSELVNAAREKWMQLCNAHAPAQLIEQVYASDAYYYNRGRLLKGWEQITGEYKYMNDPAYQLTLTPKAIQLVQPDMVYEIGKCSGSYGGHYVIRWQKQEAGDWRVTLDTNY